MCTRIVLLLVQRLEGCVWVNCLRLDLRRFSLTTVSYSWILFYFHSSGGAGCPGKDPRERHQQRGGRRARLLGHQSHRDVAWFWASSGGNPQPSECRAARAMGRADRIVALKGIVAFRPR